MPTWRGRRFRATAAGLAGCVLLAACSGARLDEGRRPVSAGPSVLTPSSAAPGGGVDAGAPLATSGGREPGVASHAAGGPVSRSGGGPAGSGAPSRGAPAETVGTGPGLFTPAEDTKGMSPTEIRLCGHAALTYGAAFDTSADDLNVYWSAVNDAGGVFGRKVRMFYENDNYTPTDAVKAATACRDKYDPFMLLGGIGFDQIPAVRNWAEQNRMLYFHHTATANGSQGKRFSYTALPTTEKVGEMFAELAAAKFPGTRVGIIKRQSENWEPGVQGFKRVAGARNVKVVLERSVPQNKGSYVQDIIDLRNAGAQVVWLWLNALEITTFVKQSKVQGYSPTFMVFPFNLTTQTLDRDALSPPIVGIGVWQAYSKGDYSGQFAAYADDMKEFEAQYRKYRPSADLDGVSGDLLFLNWSAQKAMHQLLVLCGRDCTRNRFVDLLRGFNRKLAPSACPIDFTRAGPGNDHRGGWQVSVMEAYRAPSGKVNFRNTATCVEHI